MCTSAGLYFTGVYHIVLGTLVWENWAVRETLIYVLLHCIICVLNVNFGLFILWALNWIPLSLYCCYLCCTGALYDVALLYMSGLLYNAILYDAIGTIQCCTVRCTMLYCTTFYCMMLHCAIHALHCMELYCTALHCTVCLQFWAGLKTTWG